MDTEKTAPETVLYNFMSQAEQGMILSDEEGKIHWANPAACRLLSYTEDEISRKTIGFFNLSTEVTGISEFKKKDGKAIIIRHSMQTADYGNQSWYLITIMDITAVKPIETNKNQEAINFPVITDSAAVNVWSISPDYNYTYFNDNHKAAMQEVWGEEIKIGSYLPDFLKESEYKNAVKLNYKKLLGGGYSHRSIDHFKTRSGEEKYFENFGHPIKNEMDKITGIIFYTIDITEKMKIENQLKLSVSLLESIMNSPRNLHILSIDKEYRYLFFNRAHKDSMKDTWNTSPEIGRNVFDLLPDPDHRKRVKRFYDKALQNEILTDVSEILDTGGKKNYYSNISAPVKDSDGTITGITVFTMDITDRVVAEKQTQKSLEEKEILLKEIHHRVKNNIQLITSMINLQKDLVEDEKAKTILRDSLSSINTIGLIHEALYQGDNLAEIVMEDYCGNLLETIMKFYNSGWKEINIQTYFDDISLDINQAIHVGLIINELITNSLKHAFNNVSEGTIKLSMCRTPGSKINLKVSDNGGSLNSAFDIQKTETLGLRLLNVLIKQLNGSLTINTDNGFSADIYFQPTSQRDSIDDYE